MISVRPDIKQIVEVLEASEREQRIVKLINEIYSVPVCKSLNFLSNAEFKIDFLSQNQFWSQNWVKKSIFAVQNWIKNQF